MKTISQPSSPVFGKIPDGLYKASFLLLFMICFTANSQPVMLSEIPNGSKNFVYVNGSLYFSESDKLYKATPTSAATIVKSTGETILRMYETKFNDNFFFITQDGSGEKLWRTDGTEANTVQVLSGTTTIVPLLLYDSQLFLEINSTITGTELWKMNSAFNVSLLKDINPGVAKGFTGDLIVHNNLLYFFANDGSEINLWKSDGTTAGTIISADIDDTEVHDATEFQELTSYNGELYFTRNHVNHEWGDRLAELWKSDGTTAGTAVLTIFPYGNHVYNKLTQFTVFKGRLYFFHTIGDPRYVWLSVTDGTVAGTQHLENITIDGDPHALINTGLYLLYYADSQGYTLPLEKYDGSTITTIHSFSDYISPWDDVINLTYTEGRAFFVDDVRSYYYPQRSLQLWQADLESGVTQPVREISNDISLHESGNITAADGGIFFTRKFTEQLTLWYYEPVSSSPTCEGTGSILQEIWTNVSGTSVKDFDFSTTPSGVSRPFTSFETTQYYANNYASRMRGLICVPQSGNYTFWISSDDQSELYLGTNVSEESKQLIAWVYGHTQFRNYDKYPSQKSAQVYLEAGRKYYIEARHKEGNGNDFLSVGWQMPDGTMQRPIPGNSLIPVTWTPNQPSAITIVSPQPGAIFSTSEQIPISADIMDPDGIRHVTFTFYDGDSTEFAYFEEPPYEDVWNNIYPGTYQIIVTVTDNRGARVSANVPFTVVEPCIGTGTIVREIWRNIPGTSISSIPFNTPPDNVETLTGLSTANYYANNYGSRIRGYLCPPVAGEYTLWISGDDTAELWVSTNDDPANKVKIAYVSRATRINEWYKYQTQHGVVQLRPGDRYYFEVLHKEANGADHVEVAWELPDGSQEMPIPGNRLILYEETTTNAARLVNDEVHTFEEEISFVIFPNPVDGERQIYINLPSAAHGLVNVDIKSITGVSIQNEALLGDGETVLVDLNGTVLPGMYLVTLSHEKRRWVAKLYVK